MAGLEIAGVVLGILPHLVTAAERYELVVQPFSRYRNYTSKVRDFHQRLEVQKTIFRNEIRLLLLSITDEDAANDMLCQPNHSGWQNHELDDALTTQLGESLSTCRLIIDLMVVQLDRVESKAQKLEESIQSTDQARQISSQEHCRQIKEKLKFSFSRCRLKEQLKSLHELNRNFQILSGQTERLGKCRLQSDQKASLRTKKDVKRLCAIQRASKELHRALQKACTKHTKHVAHFCVETQYIESPESFSLQIKFNMAFGHLALESSAPSRDLVWLDIKSVLDEIVSKTEAEFDQISQKLPISVKRGIEDQSNPTPKKQKKKSVHFRPSSPKPEAVEVPKLKNLCWQRNFCNQIVTMSQEYCKSSCLGLLDRTADCKHLVYHADEKERSQRSISLAQIVSTMSKNSRAEWLPQYERLRLAKSLALAILQFNATPWLKTSWQSKDILFFGIEEDSKEITALTKPYLDVRFSDTPDAISNSTVVEESRPRGLAPNPILFSLGVVLLELAYGAPLKTLQSSEDLEDGRKTQYTPWFTAKRLASLVSEKMGVSYARIVRKCLGCHFREGDDLSRQALQDEFHCDVVGELGRLEEKFRSLDL